MFPKRGKRGREREEGGGIAKEPGVFPKDLFCSLLQHFFGPCAQVHLSVHSRKKKTNKSQSLSVQHLGNAISLVLIDRM